MHPAPNTQKGTPMRKLSSMLAVVALVLGGVVAVAAPAAAAYTPPVAPIPTLPGQTGAALGGQGSVATQTYQLWKALLQYKPPAVPAPVPAAPVVPKPITAPATIARGAAGGPLIGAFVGGFAIGQAGLQLYGQATGTDPLKDICGSGFEGVGNVIYMGMMPDCTVVPPQPNADQAESVGTLTYGALSRSVTYRKDTTSVSGYTVYWWCYTGSGNPLTQGLAFEGYNNRMGAWTGAANGNPSSSVSGCPGITGWSQHSETFKNTGVRESYNQLSGALRLVNQQTKEVLATAPVTRPDPQRTPTCRIRWEDGTTTTAPGRPYKESAGVPLSSAGLGCEQAYVSKPGAGPELLPDQITVETVDESGAKTQIADQDVPAFGPDDRKGLTQGNGVGLVLEKVVNRVTDSCNTWAAHCANWWSDTQNGTVKETPTGTYRCTFGGAEVGLSQCGPYRYTFDTQTDTPVITDPQTGTQVPWETLTNQNSTNPGTGPAPGEVCMTQWASAPNPIEWILHPIKCALVWAFVPRPTVVTTTQTAIAAAWAPTIAGRLPQVVSSALAIPDGGSGCEGPAVNIPIHIGGVNVDYNGHPLSACEEPVSTLAWWARTIAAAILVWMTGLGIIRRASATVNAPGIGSS